MKTLGTILPTKESEATSDRYFRACQSRARQTAKSLDGYEKRNEQGEWID